MMNWTDLVMALMELTAQLVKANKHVKNLNYNWCYEEKEERIRIYIIMCRTTKIGLTVKVSLTRKLKLKGVEHLKNYRKIIPDRSIMCRGLRNKILACPKKLKLKHRGWGREWHEVMSKGTRAILGMALRPRWEVSLNETENQWRILGRRIIKHFKEISLGPQSGKDKKRSNNDIVLPSRSAKFN